MATEASENSVAALTAAAAGEPGRVDLKIRLGQALIVAGRWQEAEASFRAALALDAKALIADLCLAQLYERRGRPVDAARHYGRIVELEPQNAAAHNALGLCLQAAGDLVGAEAVFRMAIGCDPRLAPPRINLATLLIERHGLSEAEAQLRAVLALAPGSAVALSALGVTLFNQGRLAEALAAYRQALTLDPADSSIASNILTALQYDAGASGDLRRAAAEDWGRAAMVSIGAPPATFEDRDRRPDRPLKVGFVSGDFRAHPVGLYLMALLPHWDRARGTLHLYANQRRGDPITEILRRAADGFVDIAAADDKMAAAKIAADGIDILIDLSGHTGGNRLGLFARRAAPLQMSWLGYFASTGLPTMDFIIGDGRLLPEAESSDYRERRLLLPDCYVGFAAPEPPVAVTPPPLLRNGYPTFGSFNNAAKISPEVVRLWARLLQRLPQARLILKSGAFGDPGVAQRYLALFQSEGVTPERIRFEGHGPRQELLARYNEVDLALDPFPFGGGITSAEALWMGVPVLAKRGARYVGHVSESLLTALGLGDWVRPDAESYLDWAEQWVQDAPKLAALRASLRQRFAASALGDNARFARQFQASLAAAWVDYCAGAGAKA